MGTQPATPDLVASNSDTGQSGVWSYKQLYRWAGLLATGLLLLLLLKLFPAYDLVLLHDPVIHVLIAGSAAVLGSILALLVLQVARRAGDGRVFLIGMGFLSIASIFIIHAVATPSVLMVGGGLATSWSSIISMSVGSVFFALSGLDLAAPTNAWLMRHARTWLFLFCICWLAYSYIFLVALPAMSTASPAQIVLPTAYPASQNIHDQNEHGASSTVASAAATPTQQAAGPLLDGIRISLALLGLGCFSFAAWQHAHLYQRLPSSTGLATVGGIMLFGEALLTQQFWVIYGISFWLSHVQEFAGFGVISYAMLVAYRRGHTDEGLLESLLLPGTRARMQAGYAQAMDALVDSLGRGEQPTPSLRMALKRQFAMSESQVQVLERAAESVAKERQQRQELERLNAELHQLERAKTQFTQMLVHDLKTPLTALIGFIDVLSLYNLTDDQRALVEGSLRSGKNLSRLISDLLDISRLEEGHLELARSEVSTRELFEECVAEMKVWLNQDNKTIDVDVPTELPPLFVDEQMIQRVVLNLVSNAIKHTPPGTQITLRAYQMTPTSDDDRYIRSPSGSTEADYIALEVEDNGLGIAPQYLTRIFEKFERMPGTSHARQTSTGLGLTFCRLAVEAHGGTIAVESAPGVRTTFRVLLPSQAVLA